MFKASQVRHAKGTSTQQGGLVQTRAGRAQFTNADVSIRYGRLVNRDIVRFV